MEGLYICVGYLGKARSPFGMRLMLDLQTDNHFKISILDTLLYFTCIKSVGVWRIDRYYKNDV